MTVSFQILATSDKFWNKDEFVRFLFANQGLPIEITVAPEAVSMKTLGVYRLLESMEHKNVTVITANPLESHPYYHIKFLENHWPKKIESIDNSMHSWDQTHVFYALFGRPTAARLAIAGHLRRYHGRKSLIHFSANTGVDDLVHFEFDKLLSYRIESVKDASVLIDDLPLLLSSPDRYTDSEGYDFSDPLTNYYKNILVDVVVESHVSGETFYATEKTFRPMWMKKPFIVFASRNYLEYLRQMGFKTFWNFWNEDYDGFDTKDRLQSTLKLIDDLVKKSKSELYHMYQDMQSILDHNYNLLLDQKYSTEIVNIV
jgi:hypothetical protein